MYIYKERDLEREDERDVKERKIGKKGVAER